MHSAYHKPALLIGMLVVFAIACTDDDDVTGLLEGEIVVTAPAEALEGLQPGETAQLTAEVLSPEGQVMADQRVTWHSMSPITATISAGGVVTAGSTVSGPVTFLARSGEVEGAVQLVVLPPPVHSIRFEIPFELGSRVVTWVNTPTRIVAVPMDQHGVSQRQRVVNWSSDDPDIVEVSRTGNVRGVTFPGRGEVRAEVVNEDGSVVSNTIGVTVGSTYDACLEKAGTLTVPMTVTGNTRDTDCRRTDPGQFATPPAHPWLLEVTSRQTVNIRLNSTAFDAFLILTTDEYELIAEDDDSGGGPANRNAWIQTTLDPGTYVVFVSSYSARVRPVKSSYGGAGLGSYELVIN